MFEMMRENINLLVTFYIDKLLILLNPLLQKIGILDPRFQSVYYFAFGWLLTHLFFYLIIPITFFPILIYCGKILFISFNLFLLRCVSGFRSEKLHTVETVKSYLSLNLRYMKMWTDDNIFLTGVMFAILNQMMDGFGILFYFIPASFLYICFINRYPIVPISFRKESFDFVELVEKEEPSQKEN